jgi:peptide deformylase
MKIITIPHPMLTKVAKPVDKIDKRVAKLVKEMEKALDAQKDPEGVGLSAPQVNLDMRIFIVKHPQDRKLHTFINPELIAMEYMKKKTREDEEYYDDDNLEGCLSIPGIWAPVKRYDRVHVRYTELDGTTREEWYTGFLSVVVQHEYDHLEGILFTQRALEQGNPIYKEVNGKLREIDYA